MPSTPSDRHEELRRQFRNATSHERLRTARDLSKSVTPEDAPFLRTLLRDERVSFVKRALEQAIERLESGASEPTFSGEEPEQESDGQSYTQAVEWVTGTLLHEILPRVGAIELEAQRSVSNYESSQLKAKIDNLSSLMDGVEDLRKATISRLLTEFTIADIVSKNVATVELPEQVVISFEGKRDVVALGEPNLVSIALCNGIRNAIEACLACEGQKRIVVSWGETEVDYWISVIDEGPGFLGTPEAAFEIGKSTKRGHRGFGLAIARQAMKTMSGSVSLRPNTPRGAAFEMRWFK